MVMSHDVLSDLLRCVRVRGAVFYYVSCCDQWAAQSSSSSEIAQAVLPGCEHVMEFHMMLKGNAWAAVIGEQPARLSSGDIVMFAHGDAHVIGSAPGLPALYRSPEMVMSTRHLPKPVMLTLHHGAMQPGTPQPAHDADAIVVCGFLGCDLKPFNPLVTALPHLLHLPADQAGDWVKHVIDQAAIESYNPRPGSDALLERLSEMMFVDTARRYLENLPENATGWLAGLRDRYVGKALACLHKHPQKNWTVDELAREVGLSRSALYDRFMDYIHIPPMQYLTNWRIQLGSRMLRESSRTVATIAQEVGYETEASFSRAFKRMVGSPPAAWRKEQAGRVH